jgi:hypothetical protein
LTAKPKLRNMDPDSESCPVVGAIRAIVTESRLLGVRHSRRH